MTIAEKQEQLLEELALFPEWEDRYQYVIDLGKRLPPMDEAAKNPEHLIKGCQAQVWIDASFEGGRIRYHADSNSLITRGIVALFLRILDGETPDVILTADMGFIDHTGLKEHLVGTRANALKLVPTRMKQYALSFASQPS